jgi:hypothetical protein
MLADVPFVPRLPFGYSPYVSIGYSDVWVFIVDVRVAVVAVVVLLSPHVAAGSSKVIQRGAEDCAHVLVVAHCSVIRIVLNRHADQRHATAPSYARQEAEGEGG